MRKIQVRIKRTFYPRRMTHLERLRIMQLTRRRTCGAILVPRRSHLERLNQWGQTKSMMKDRHMSDFRAKQALSLGAQIKGIMSLSKGLWPIRSRVNRSLPYAQVPQKSVLNQSLNFRQCLLYHLVSIKKMIHHQLSSATK